MPQKKNPDFAELIRGRTGKVYGDLMRNRFFNPNLAGGALLDIGVYSITLARLFLESCPGEMVSLMLDLTFVRSTNVGCRRLTELFLSRTDPPSTADVAEAHAFAARLFSPVVSEGGLHCGGKGAPATLVVTGGTSTSLVAIRDELVPYDASRVHLATLSADDVIGLEGRLAALTEEGRRALPGLQEKRASVILGGTIAVSELMLLTNTTQTVDVDIWDYWHFAFTGALVAIVTNSLVWGIIAAVLNMVEAFKRYIG